MMLYRLRPRLALTLAGLLLAVNGGLLLWHLEQNYAYTQENRAIYRPFLEQPLKQALVFVPPLSGPFLLAPFAWLGNSPGLNDPVLYAVNLGRQNFSLLEAYPERTPYRFDYYGPFTKSPHDNPTTRLVKLERLQFDRFSQRLQITNPTNQPYVYTQLLNGRQTQTYLLDEASSQGRRYKVEWLITPAGAELRGDYRPQPLTVGPSGLTGLTDTAPLIISVAFSHGPERQTQQIYEWRFDFRLTADGRLELITPPESWHNPLWPSAGWQMGPITAIIASQ